MVVGRVTDHEFMLEAAQDRFSKRARGRLNKMQSGTVIELEWETPFWSWIWGSESFDENEILTFLKDWLEAEVVPVH